MRGIATDDVRVVYVCVCLLDTPVSPAAKLSGQDWSKCRLGWVSFSCSYRSRMQQKQTVKMRIL